VPAKRRPEHAFTVACGLLAGLAAGAANAQYFGGNKVRYESQDFRVLETEHFDIYTYEEEDARAGEAAVMMERWNHRLENLLNHELRGRQPLILYAGHPHFRQTNATPGEIGEGTGGFTEMFKRRIVLPFTGAPGETDHVLGHELVHAFQFDISKKATENAKDRAAGQGALRLPLWFIEGMAEYLSTGSVDPHTAMWMRDAIVHDDLPTIEKLNSPRYFPYRYGHAFWAYVAGRFGDEAVQRMLKTAIRTGELTRALRAELKVDHKQLSKDWHDALRGHYGPELVTGDTADKLGRALVPARRGKGAINVAPSISPDGKRLMYFSERDLFSIELYLVDVDSGEVIRRLTKAATDPHLDSLQFLSSAGSWSPDGKQVVLGSIGAGRPELAIIDVESGDTVATHRFEDLVEVVHPAWSPDGKTIAFAGNAGGVYQLQLLDLDTKQRRTLTTGPYASMQPAWSPDGARLAFVTDRFTSDAQKLTYGEYRLGQVDVATGAITALPDIEGGKNINPQYSPDGAHLYFLSDAFGGPNLYRLGLASGAIEQMTDVKTGLSGITRLSPALSVAARANNRIAASVFDKGMYHIYMIENVQTRSVAARRAPGAPVPGALPPRDRADHLVDRALAEAVPSREAVVIEGPEEYRPRLGIDYIGQVSAGVGTNNAGSFVGGGVSMYWSDMLGDHNLLTALQVEGDADTFDRNLLAVANYENRENRWRWGAAVGQLPSLAIGYTTEFGDFNGEPARKDSLIRQWQINREVAARTAYPFTRADRFEASIGYRHVSYVSDAIVQYVSTDTGLILATGVEDLPAPPSIELVPIGFAFVHDTSVFGGTAPAAGQRYRIEAGGTGGGDIVYWSPLVDFRQYFLLGQHLTLGGRFLHYGRYGRDAEDPRIGQVFIGGTTLVRGYSSGSFSVGECDDPSGTTCPVFDQLFGSRIAMASAEARLPIFGARGIIATPQVPPIDIAAFYDTGVAWTRGEEAAFLGGPRELVSSYGTSVRLNFFGALVLTWN
jgi:Tol biopolymer transport system component